MTKISKLAAAAIVAAMGIASPAFAQSFDPDVGSGNIVPFNSGSNAVQHDRIVVRHRGRDVIAVRQSGLHAFAMVPGDQPVRSSNDPALTGGGSLGYNQNIYNY
jgi:hypothetical protein